jgi:putative aminopeptidase FrvX
MTQQHYQLLKEVLGVQTKTYEETRMIAFLTHYLDQRGYIYYLDHKRNIYVTKGEAQVYPCVLAHTDTVHNIGTMRVVEIQGRRPQSEYMNQQFNDVEPRLMLTGRDARGNPSGIGGDDKCGVYVCLRLLEEMDNLKVAFFVSEETGCHGSKEADPEFFQNVGYAIQFDAPGNSIVTEFCSGVRLFDRESEFFRIAHQTLHDFGPWQYQSHPYTDVSQLKRKFDFSCINLACGYYRMHSPHELVDVEDVERTVEVGLAMLAQLGQQKYEYVVDYEAEQRERDRQWAERNREYHQWLESPEGQAHRQRLAEMKQRYKGFSPWFMEGDDDDFWGHLEE